MIALMNDIISNYKYNEIEKYNVRSYHMKVRMIRVPIHILRLRKNILILYLKD